MVIDVNEVGMAASILLTAGCIKRLFLILHFTVFQHCVLVDFRPL